MILFKIVFTYKDNEIEGFVHELETYPKQWHITIKDEKLPARLRDTHIIAYDYKAEIYTWGFLDVDTDHSFANSMGESLMEYIKKYGWNSTSI